jgi:uroporphyrin-III C-methyltransferase/precorrin-2 dehydrogenase/sirohydrochlorin ferrochelatase
MEYLPVGWRVRQQWVLIAGGGEAALGVARRLHDAGACLRVVALAVNEELAWLTAQSGGMVIQREYARVDLDDMVLAVGADDDAALNQALATDAADKGCPVHVVERPELSSLDFPALIDRDPLLIGVHTGEAGPVLREWIRAQIESWLPARWGGVARLPGEFRERLAEKLPERSARQRFWRRVLHSPVVEQILAGQESSARQQLEAAVDAADASTLSGGEVYLVGAGPGDPDLMTFRGLRLLQKADIVLHDRLIPDEILAFARDGAEKLYVGKARDTHSLPQANINDLLVHYARQGFNVCRLKGGDPFIFGRGGEELEKVAEAGIDFQVVPGITAASGCSTYAGIPLTHRDHAQSVRFVTGHRKQGGAELDWAALIQPAETLVFYMGLVSLPDIADGLIRNGMDAATPAALVSRGTLDTQDVVVGTLGDLPDEVARREVHAPTVIIVGDVVELYPRYQWFQRPRT